MGDCLLRRRRAPHCDWSSVVCASLRRVACEDAVRGGAGAGVGLRTGDQQSPDVVLGQDVLEPGVLEGPAVGLDQRLGGVRLELGDDPPAVAAVLEAVVGVLHPDDRDLLCSGPGDQAADVGHHGVPLVSAADDVVLDVDHDEGGPRTVPGPSTPAAESTHL